MTYAFHNSTKEAGKVLDNLESITKKQDKQILAFMKQHPGVKFTPYQVFEKLGWKD